MATVEYYSMHNLHRLDTIEADQMVGPGKTPYHFAWKSDWFQVFFATEQPQ